MREKKFQADKPGNFYAIKLRDKNGKKGYFRLLPAFEVVFQLPFSGELKYAFCAVREAMEARISRKVTKLTWPIIALEGGLEVVFGG